MRKADDPKYWTALRKAHYDYFAKNLPGDKSKTLVDLGAGPTQFRKVFCKYDYVGVDFKPFEFVTKVADLTKPIDFPDNSCDIVTLSNVLEHIPNPQDFLKESFRILKPGGMVIGALPFFISLHQEPYDFYRYTGYALQHLLENAGFSNIGVENIGSPCYVYKETQNKFFEVFLSDKPKSFKKYVYILLTKLTLWQTRFFKPILSQSPLNNTFPNSYGFRGYKYVDKIVTR